MDHGRVGGPSEVALYGVFISLTVMQLGFVFLLTFMGVIIYLDIMKTLGS